MNLINKVMKSSVSSSKPNMGGASKPTGTKPNMLSNRPKISTSSPSTTSGAAAAGATKESEKKVGQRQVNI